MFEFPGVRLANVKNPDFVAGSFVSLSFAVKTGDDHRAVFGQAPGDRFADATPGAGYQRHLVAESSVRAIILRS